ncbi:MAG: alpha/beta hydrolase [Cyanobacteria bacterium P01_A01_bin.83]
MQETKIGKWFRNTGLAIFLAGMAISLTPDQAQASEEIIFTYGGASQSVSLSELQTFADTGEASPSLDFLLNFGKQNPLLIRWILKQEFPANTTLIYDLLNTAPGEYVLSQTSNVVGTRSQRANVKALRGALVASASDDNIISLIELLEDYPTEKVYVDGKLLAKARKNLSQFIEETSKYIQVPISFLLD